LKDANDYIDEKLQYFNSEASELDKKQKTKKRKMNRTLSYDENDFNDVFDSFNDSTDEQLVPNINEDKNAVPKTVGV
jgi:hypothetical protein